MAMSEIASVQMLREVLRNGIRVVPGIRVAATTHLSNVSTATPDMTACIAEATILALLITFELVRAKSAGSRLYLPLGFGARVPGLTGSSLNTPPAF